MARSYCTTNVRPINNWGKFTQLLPYQATWSSNHGINELFWKLICMWAWATPLFETAPERLKMLWWMGIGLWLSSLQDPLSLHIITPFYCPSPTYWRPRAFPLRCNSRGQPKQLWQTAHHSGRFPPQWPYKAGSAGAIHKRLKRITNSHVENHILHSLNEIDGETKYWMILLQMSWHRGNTTSL